MFAVDGLILLAAVLVLVAVASSAFSARAGVPVLAVFLLVGMLARSKGIGRIAFEDCPLAHGIGTSAPVLILFDGGLRTPPSPRSGWPWRRPFPSPRWACWSPPSSRACAPDGSWT